MSDFEIREISAKWFAESVPTNYAGNASASVGSGTNKKITVVADEQTTTVKIAIVAGAAADAAMSAALAAGKITITLGKDADNALDDTKNTATLIATAISAVTGFTATADGTGASAFGSSDVTSTDIAFTNGTDGTPCPMAGLCVHDATSGYYYVCVTANNTKKNAGWKKFQLVNL